MSTFNCNGMVIFHQLWFQLKVKFHQIVSKMIYHIDIIIFSLNKLTFESKSLSEFE
jgi:hypothetical protein